MNIERDKQIRFHEMGTLDAVTRWIRGHDEGLAEWLKNARRAYQRDRADVEEVHRAAVLLMIDAQGEQPARLGLLDVGGATLEDLDRWSTWQDPEASSRSQPTGEEVTQGNGGKAYMYRLFSGLTQIVGVRAGRLSRKGLVGRVGSLERGTPGFIPDIPSGRDRELSSLTAELSRILESYDIRENELPADIRIAINARQSFTLVEGVDPIEIYNGKLDAQDLIFRLLRHDQSALAIQQLRLYAIWNGRALTGR